MLGLLTTLSHDALHPTLPRLAGFQLPCNRFDQLRHALGRASRAATFRYLRQVRHLRSYNHNGRFYTDRDPTRFDRFGLLSLGDVHFSRDGSLAASRSSDLTAALEPGVIIEVLLVLVRRPGSLPAEVARHLQDHFPPILLAQVQAVFDRFDLAAIGEKGGLQSLLTLLLEQAREAGWTGERTAHATLVAGAPPSVDFIAEVRHCPQCGRTLSPQKSKTRRLAGLAGCAVQGGAGPGTTPANGRPQRVRYCCRSPLWTPSKRLHYPERQSCWRC